MRRLVLLFYLCDGTLEVHEPKQANSGLAQGVFLARARVAKADGLLSPSDFSVGSSLTLAGRKLQLVGADAFTRDYYAARGQPQAPDSPIPEGQAGSRSAVKASAPPPDRAALRAQSDNITRGMRFLAHDGKVLRFDGLLSERDVEPRQVTVCFFLADATLEIAPKTKDTLILHRQRLPIIARGAGVDTVGADEGAAFVDAPSLRVGSSLDVYSRQLLLTDADAWTRDWFATTLGFEQPPALPPPAAPAAPQPRPSPPHDGYGTPEDSIRNVGTLIPKKPTDVTAFERFQAHSTQSLRFTASMVAASAAKPLHPTDEGRNFVISVFLEDHTVAVFEQPQRGVPGGRFLERIRCPCPGAGSEGPWLTSADFKVGAKVVLFGRAFLINGADAWTEGHQAAEAEATVQ